MKRLIILFLSLLICCTSIQNGQAQTVDEMIKRFRKCEKAEYERISSIMIGVMRMVMPKDLSSLEEVPEEELNKILAEHNMTKTEFVEMSRFLSEFLNHTKSLSMLSLDLCSAADRQTFINTCKNWNPEGCIREEEECEEGVNCFIKKKGDKISEIIAVSFTPEDCSITTMKGDLAPSFIKNAEKTLDQIFEKLE